MGCEFDFKKAIGVSVVTALAIEAGIQTVHRITQPEAARAFQALVADNPRCKEVLPHPQHYQAIVVFGAGVTVGKDGVARPNSFQIERVRAASAAVVAGYSDRILLIDDANGLTQGASADLAKKYVSDLSFGQITLEDSQIVSIDDSLNTAENIEDLKEYMKRNGISRVLGISDLFHYNRLNLLRENYDVEMDIAPTECIAVRYLPLDIPYLIRRNYSPDMIGLFAKEKLAIFELSIDKEGEMTTILRRLEQLPGSLLEQIAEDK